MIFEPVKVYSARLVANLYWRRSTLVSDPIVNKDPEILGGTPVFMGTRVPIKAIFDYLENGDSLDEFLDDFPGVSREQAIGILEIARNSVTGSDEAAA